MTSFIYSIRKIIVPCSVVEIGVKRVGKVVTRLEVVVTVPFSRALESAIVEARLVWLWLVCTVK